jgi:AraC-like DNA-binding protein
MMREVRLALKNMIAHSCVRLVQLELQKLSGVEALQVSLGEVWLKINDEICTQEKLNFFFQEIGFPVLHDPETTIAEKAKVAAIELIYYANNTSSIIRNSDYISDKLGLPYQKISKIFSKVKGITLEKYIISLKIEKSKELIAGNQYTLSEIAFMLGYSSVQYLSNQFKKITGVTVSEFKENPKQYKKPLDELCH